MKDLPAICDEGGQYEFGEEDNQKWIKGLELAGQDNWTCVGCVGQEILFE